MLPSPGYNTPHNGMVIANHRYMQIRYLLFILLFGTMTIPAFGDSIGIAVSGLGRGNTTQIDCPGGSDVSPCVDPDGTIKVFIPLTGGISADLHTYPNYGTTRDTIPDGTVNSSGYVDLFLYFDLNGDSYSNAILTLNTTDFDFMGVNDPNRRNLSIVEGLVFYTPSGDITIDDISDSGVGFSLSGNYDEQTIVFDLNMLGFTLDDPDFWARIRLMTTDVTNTTGWSARNTYEDVLATVETYSVPEPSTLLLFSTGLLLAGAAFRKRLH